MIFKKIFLLIIATIFLYSSLHAASTSSGSSSNVGSKMKKLTSYKSGENRVLKAKKYEKKGKLDKANKLYKEALIFLNKANSEKELDPDTLNYLGFVNRKLGNLKDSEVYYLLGLNEDPNHIGLNEYLGELYFETNRIDKAKERLMVLKNCNCKEYNELKEIIAGTKKSKY